MKATDSKKTRPGYQPIPGYTLEEMIGRGGFGEVWRADAPGGLKKAVKFVYGTQDQTRASRELRSLERIKGVHHPFLLTLERFEIVDDQLVIVTELADGSLEDVFKRNRDRGSCGIPREALISHLQDAADALDYLHECYQLQHLDIKPGNLLMVGGHVKVADFGLLKDLTEADCSLVGGLTPIYAPPEVFDGRPSLHSDQYSLAVMYQELLTGTRPFSGRTIAQLATQHVHSAPNLEPLPPSDRPVAARALEKSPERRFPNCKEFVKALHSPRSRSAIITGDQLGGDSPLAEMENEVEDLPQLGGQSEIGDRICNHAMVVALGGTGADCLRELRQRCVDLHSAAPMDLHGVLIDTDIATIHSMRVTEASDRIPSCQTIHIPLRSAHEYRQVGTERLTSISRRWIYNVPRSRSTEGMRPLGRLALVDHGPEVKQALTEAIEKLRESSADDHPPKIYVLGSLSGGTSSGIYIDVVHLLRHLLDEAGMEGTSILSLLATAELRADPSTPLAMHDTHAAMIEMQHFMCPGNGYPGDAGAGFPSVPAARTPLHDVYLVAAAQRGSSTPSPARAITEYVWTDATGGGELLAAARSVAGDKNESSIGPPALRSVGLVSLGVARSLEQKLLAPAVVRHLLVRWLGLPSKARELAVPFSERLIRRCAISQQAFVDATFDLIGADEAERSQRISDHLVNLSKDVRTCDQSLGEAMYDMLRGRCSSENDLMIESVLTNFRREVSVSLHDGRVDITTVIESIKMVMDAALRKTPEQVESAPAEDAEASQEPQQDSPDSVGAMLHQGLEEPWEELDSHPFDRQSRILAEQVNRIADERLQRLCAALNQIKGRFERFATNLAMAIVRVTKEQSSDKNPWDEMPDEIQQRFEPTLGKLHELTVSRWLLRPLSDSPSSVADAKEMVADLSEEAMPVVSEIFDEGSDRGAMEDSQSMTATDVTVSLSGTSDMLHESTIVTQPLSPGAFSDSHSCDGPLPVEQAITAVRPALLACGGQQRLLLVVGTEIERDQLEPKVRELQSGALTVALIPGATPKLIHEAQKIEVKQILAMLGKLNGENARVTSRLVTRTDVRWDAGPA